MSIIKQLNMFNCCLSAILWLEKGDYSENSQVVFCPNEQRYCEPFTCSDLLCDC